MVRFGVHVTPEGVEMAELHDVWKLAERLGFEWISVWDHLLPMLGFDDRGSFEGVATQAALAAATSRVRVGSLVYCSSYRNPLVLAAAAATIDHISRGRMELGVGAGWCAPEYEAMGLSFELPGARLRRLKEFVDIVRELWTGAPVDFEGEFYRVRQGRAHPPYQERPRIWLGVQGERALRLAGQIADGWNCPQVTPEQFAAKRRIVLDSATDPDAIITSVGPNFLFTDGDVMTEVKRRMRDTLRFGSNWSSDGRRPIDGTMAGTVEQVREATGRYVEAGANWIILRMFAPYRTDELELFATEVMPEFATPAVA